MLPPSLLVLLQAVLLGLTLLLLCGDKKKDGEPPSQTPNSSSRVKSPQRAAHLASVRQQEKSQKAESSMKETGVKNERKTMESSRKDAASYSSQTVLIQNMTDAMEKKTFPSVQVPENQRKKATSRDGSKKLQQVSFAATVARSKQSLRTKKRPSTPIDTLDNSEKSSKRE